MTKLLPKFENKKILILGLGLLGRGLKDAIFFAEKKADVIVTDLKNFTELKTSLEQLKKYPNIKYTLGEHKEEDILNADLIIRNAGIPRNSQYLKLAFANKIKVDMDESLFAEYCPCPIIGITGTRGKSTTTTLIGQMLQKIWASEKRKVYISGNLQGEATLPLLDKVTKNDLVILELSSWQLQGFGWKKISPQISVFTNIYPDHLNSYKNMRDYINDKKLIFQNQKKSDYCIINGENNYTKKIKDEIKSNTVLFYKKDVPKTWQLKVKGDHNLENISATLAVGKILGFKNTQMQKSIEEFTGIEHRLEYVDTINEIAFINDTTSTTPIAGNMAINSIDSPIILLAGGASKNLNLTSFAKNIAKKVKAVVLLEGSATDELEKKIIKYGGEKNLTGRFNDFKQAIDHAYGLALPGDTILLSPGCASFGMFINEFDRGEQFKKIVKQFN